MVSQETEGQSFFVLRNDQFELTPVHQHILDSLKRLENKSLYDIHINGYTNSIGNLTTIWNSPENAAQVKRNCGPSPSFLPQDMANWKPRPPTIAGSIFWFISKDHIPEAGEIVEAPIDEFENQPTVASLVTPKIGDKVILPGHHVLPGQGRYYG